MSRCDRRSAGDYRPRVELPEGQGDEPRIKLAQDVVDHAATCPDGRNGYTCETCGFTTVTVHAHPGVTPGMLGCRALPGCEGTARSRFYTQISPPEDVSVWEWYRPAQPEYDHLDGASRNHVDQGGLLLRLRSGAAPARVREETDPEKRARVAALFGGTR